MIWIELYKSSKKYKMDTYIIIIIIIIIIILHSVGAHKGSPVIPNLCRISRITCIDTYFFKIHSNIVLPSTSWPS